MPGPAPGSRAAFVARQRPWQPAASVRSRTARVSLACRPCGLGRVAVGTGGGTGGWHGQGGRGGVDRLVGGANRRLRLGVAAAGFAPVTFDEGTGGGGRNQRDEQEAEHTVGLLRGPAARAGPLPNRFCAAGQSDRFLGNRDLDRDLFGQVGPHPWRIAVVVPRIVGHEIDQLFGARIGKVGAFETRQHHRDVVGTLAFQRARDQSVAGLLEIGLLLQDVQDLVVADRAVQPVGADQHDVALAQGDLRHHHLDPFLHAQRLQDDVGVLEALGFFGGHRARFHQLPGQRLVLRDLGQAAVTFDVAARIADLPDHQGAVDHRGGGAGGAHAAFVLVVARLREDAIVGVFDRAAQAARESVAFQRLGGLQGGDDGVDRHLRGHLAGGSAAHAVADQEQRALGAEFDGQRRVRTLAPAGRARRPARGGCPRCARESTRRRSCRRP